MDSQIVNAILKQEKSGGHSLTKEEILGHLENLEQIRVNHLLSTEKKASHSPEKHGMQIMKYVKAIAKDFNCSPEETALIACAARLHDIGKIKIPGDILNKPEKLSEEEYEELKMHTIYGHELVYPLTFIANLIRHHHERYDGNGYPDGLAGKKVPLGSRIIAVIDAFNAMTHQRSYNKVKTRDEAVAELKRNAGTQFDPDVVKRFISVLNTMWLRRNIDFVDA